MSMTGALAPITASEIQEIRRDPKKALAHIGGAKEVSLEKMWQAVHFLLTGSPDGGPAPLGEAVLGGDEVGDDVGYGPARILSPDRVQAVAAALSAISRDELRRRFRPDELTRAEIYPRVWDEPEDDLFDEIFDYFDQMKQCYAAAARDGHGMLLSLS
jgi:hypothetical protein